MRLAPLPAPPVRPAASAALACLLAAACLVAGCTAIKADRARLNAWDDYEDGRLLEARESFEAAVDYDSTDWVSHYYLGRIALREGQAARARRHFELAETIRDTNPSARYGQEVPQGDRVVPRPSRAQVTDGVAESIFQQGQTTQLFGYLRQVVDEHGTTEDYLRLAKYLHKAGDHDAARTTYVKTIQLAPHTDPEPYLAFADFYDAIGDRDAALTQLRHAYFIDPNRKGLADRIRAHGMVPGPTIALPPVQQ